MKAFKPHEKIFLSIDVKTKAEEDLVEVIEILKSLKMEERVVMGSFKYFNFHKLKEKYGWKNINFFGGNKQCELVIYGYILGFIPYVNTDCDAFFLPYYFESLPNVSEFPRFKNKIVWTLW